MKMFFCLASVLSSPLSCENLLLRHFTAFTERRQGGDTEETEGTERRQRRQRGDREEAEETERRQRGGRGGREETERRQRRQRGDREGTE